MHDSFKLVGVVDFDDSRVERLVDVSANLGLIDKINITLLLDQGRELSRGDVVLGQVVEKDNFLLTRGDNCWLH